MISLKEIHIKIILVQFEGSNITFALPEFPLIKTLIPIFEQKLIVSDLSVLGLRCVLGSLSQTRVSRVLD